MDSDCCTVDSVAFIHSMEFCPFEGGLDLIAIADNESLSIKSCKFFNDEQDGTGNNYIRNIQNDLVFEHVTLIKLKVSEVICIAWSPVTNVRYLPKKVVIAAGTYNGVVNVYSTDLKEETLVTSLEGHLDSVNAVAYEPLEGLELASVSDDHSCKVWDVETQELLVSFPLQYSGVAVCWHPQQPSKLMVAELGGKIRFYNVELKQAVQTLDCKKEGIMSADWCWLNPVKIGATAHLEWFLWDMSRSSYPLDSQQAHSVQSNKFLWSKHHEDVFLTLGGPKNTLKIYHLGHRQPILHKTHVSGSCATWHSQLPVCAVAGNKAIHFYDVKVRTQF